MPALPPLADRTSARRAVIARSQSAAPDVTPANRRSRGARPIHRAGRSASAIVTPPGAAREPVRRPRAGPPSRLPRSSARSAATWSRETGAARRRHVGQIEHDEPEAAGLENQGERLERARRVAAVAHPQHARQIDAERRRRRRIERVARVDNRRDASPRRVAAAISPPVSVVRPLDAAPTISDRWPRRSPPPSAASSAAPPVAASRSGGSIRPRAAASSA